MTPHVIHGTEDGFGRLYDTHIFHMQYGSEAWMWYKYNTISRVDVHG